MTDAGSVPGAGGEPSTPPDADADRDPAADLRVLSLVTNDEASFYRQQVAALERQGVDCTTVAVPGRHVSGESTRSPLGYLRFLGMTLRRADGPYDLVHANYGLTGPFALLLRDLPVVLSLWGSDLFGTVGPVSRWCARRADEVVVMSAAMDRAVDRECHVVPHGVDTDRFRPMDRAAARGEVGWSDGCRHVLFPYGPNREVKDYPRAERVVDAARDRLGRPVELHTLSGVAHERVATYMNAADALVLTSRSEGSPNTVKEAMACNLPVVATDVGDVRERLEGVSPSAVHDADPELVRALASILEEGARSNGREAVADLSLDRVGERMRRVYELALGRSPTASAGDVVHQSATDR